MFKLFSSFMLDLLEVLLTLAQGVIPRILIVAAVRYLLLLLRRGVFREDEGANTEHVLRLADYVRREVFNLLLVSAFIPYSHERRR